jgi:hypothetical protein
MVYSSFQTKEDEPCLRLPCSRSVTREPKVVPDKLARVENVTTLIRHLEVVVLVGKDDLPLMHQPHVELTSED